MENFDNESNKIESDGKRLEYERLCAGAPEAICILTSGVRENPVNKERPLQSDSYKGVDEHGLMTGGKARVIAAAELCAYFPEAQVITNGAAVIPSKIPSQEGKKIPVDVSEMISKELEHLGVSKDHIISQNRSYSTFTELVALIKLIAQNEWHHVVVVVNETQKERSEVMFEKMDTLHDPNKASEEQEFKEALEKIKTLDITVTFVCAEDILPLRDAHYNKIVELAKASESWKKRMDVEKKAAQQIRDGLYWKNLPPNFIKPDEYYKPNDDKK